MGLGNSLLCRPVHGGMFSSILGLYPRESYSLSLPLVVTMKTVSRLCQMSHGEPHRLQLWTTALIAALALSFCTTAPSHGFVCSPELCFLTCLSSWIYSLFVPMSVMKWFLFRWTIASIALNTITFQSFSYLISQCFSMLIASPPWNGLFPNTYISWPNLWSLGQQGELGLLSPCGFVKEPSSKVLARALSYGGKRVPHTKREQASQSKPFSSFCLKHIC